MKIKVIKANGWYTGVLGGVYDVEEVNNELKAYKVKANDGKTEAIQYIPFDDVKVLMDEKKIVINKEEFKEIKSLIEDLERLDKNRIGGGVEGRYCRIEKDNDDDYNITFLKIY